MANQPNNNKKKSKNKKGSSTFSFIECDDSFRGTAAHHPAQGRGRRVQPVLEYRRHSLLW